MRSIHYVKELPGEEIELHGDKETYQYPVSSITAMQVSLMDHPFMGGEEAPYWVLRVLIGYASEYSSEERIIFTSPTEEGVQEIRAQINRIRFRKYESGPCVAPNPAGYLLRLKVWIYRRLRL